MRKVNVPEFVSLDGVIQAPGGPEEDISDGFVYGGWISPHSDPVGATAVKKQMNMPFDLLIGRRTFDNFASFWPRHLAGGQHCDQVGRLEYRDFSRMAAARLSKRRYCEKITKIKQQEGRICAFMEAQITFRRSSSMILSMPSG
jgi:hypothetical protein